MKRSAAGLLLAMAISAFTPAFAGAAEVDTRSNVVTATAVCDAGNSRGGAAALAALVSAAVNAGVSNVACGVDVLNNSLNNLLQNADIHAIENILNNSPVLSGITIQDITVNALTGVTTITVLGGPVIALQ